MIGDNYDCDHTLCNAHLLRELVFLWEEQSQKCAQAMIDHLLAIKENVATARKNGLNALDALQRVFLGNPFVPTPKTS